MKVSISCFGEAVLWRKARHTRDPNLLGSEWVDAVFLGISGMSTYALICTATGFVRTRDYRMAPEGRWSRELVLYCKTLFEEYVVPATLDPATGRLLSLMSPTSRLMARPRRLKV